VRTEQFVFLASQFCRIKIHTLETPASCTHEVAVPPSSQFQGLTHSGREPAKTYPFVLGRIFLKSTMCKIGIEILMSIFLAPMITPSFKKDSGHCHKT
jgi:hypothetical protein